MAGRKLANPVSPDMSFRTRLKLYGERISLIPFPYLLIRAGILHLSLSALINLAGRVHLLPGLFDANGISGAFAYDSFLYRQKSIELVAMLARGSITDWFHAPQPLHVKLYSLSFVVWSPLFGFTILSVEPLNLLYYLLTITLIFKLSEELFDRRTALLATAIVALWPSFLLHTMQLLREPLFFVAMLTLLLVTTRWLTREPSLRGGFVEALAGAAASTVVWLTRYNMWMMLIGVVLLAVVFLLIRQLRQRVWLWGNVAGAGLLLVLITLIPFVVGRFLQPDPFLLKSFATAQESPLPIRPCPDESLLSSTTETEGATVGARLQHRADALVARLGKIRRAYDYSYAQAGSNMDSCVSLSNMGDLVRYLPRAVAHGFLAPYPNMWFGSGNSVGLAGRLLSGLEMLVIYIVELLAVIGMWSGRLRLPVWLIMLTAVTGIIALGLVIPNAAILFRMRYVFWMMLIILAARGAMQASSIWHSKRAQWSA